MNYKLSTKVDGKWRTFGNIKTSPKGYNQASFRIKELKELIVQTEKEGKEWVNLSLFEDDGAQKKHTQTKANAYVSDFEDEIPY